MFMYSLVYVSLEIHPMTDSDLVDILTIARGKNLTLDITGLLLYRGGFFMQLLEGPEDAVDALYERVRRDERHSDVLLIYKENIVEREFPGWSMGFSTIDHTINRLEGFTDFIHSPSPYFFLGQASKAKKLLHTFRVQHPFCNMMPGSSTTPESAARQLMETAELKGAVL
ncbi:MAG: BLUF domain-containing protein [Methylococcaceae bacterium]